MIFPDLFVNEACSLVVYISRLCTRCHVCCDESHDKIDLMVVVRGSRRRTKDIYQSSEADRSSEMLHATKKGTGEHHTSIDGTTEEPSISTGPLKACFHRSPQTPTNSHISSWLLITIYLCFSCVVLVVGHFNSAVCACALDPGYF